MPRSRGLAGKVRHATDHLSKAPWTKMKPNHVPQIHLIGKLEMHTTTPKPGRLAKAVVDGAGMEDRVSVAVCPPFPIWPLSGEFSRQAGHARGADPLSREGRRVHWRGQPTMLVDLGCKYVILGHSERRHKLGESDAFINQRLVALAASLNVIFCVGETLDQRKADQTEAVLDRQIVKGLASLSVDTLARLIIAYEPVWAIGGHGQHATPQQAQTAHALIRRRFGQLFGEKSAQKLVIQYGGSVKPENAAALLAQHACGRRPHCGASLDADQFLAIIQIGVGESQAEGNQHDSNRTIENWKPIRNYERKENRGRRRTGNSSARILQLLSA